MNTGVLRLWADAPAAATAVPLRGQMARDSVRHAASDIFGLMNFAGSTVPA
jgi:hypothetical protein